MELKTAAGVAGKVCGTAWRGLQWANHQIDWREVGAIVWHGLIVLAVMTYHAGYETGRAVHCANDTLAALWRRLWVPQDAAVAPVMTAHPPAVLAQPAIHPLALIADDLQLLSCRQLRQLGGIRAKRSKAYLIAALCAA